VVHGSEEQPRASNGVEIPADATEESLIREIKELTAPKKTNLSPSNEFLFLAKEKARAVTYIDALLERYPQTSFKTEALMSKLALLADLSRLRADYLVELLNLTTELSRKDIPPELAEANAYYEIQAFVLGARHEKMPERRRLRGTVERYRAFIEEFSQSPRVPTIRASLIRNLIGLDRIEQAKRELAELKKRFPDDQATRRATGEVWRATAVGRPVEITHTMPDGKVLRTADAAGEVVILHFWSLRNKKPSMVSLGRLLKLREAYRERPLRIIGVNLDVDILAGSMRPAVEELLRERNMDWPQYFDNAGRRSELLVKLGVIKIPAHYVIDGKGILRSTDPGDKLEALVAELLKE
jgi:hypothetical protein